MIFSVKNYIFVISKDVNKIRTHEYPRIKITTNRKWISVVMGTSIFYTHMLMEVDMNIIVSVPVDTRTSYILL